MSSKSSWIAGAGCGFAIGFSLSIWMGVYFEREVGNEVNIVARETFLKTRSLMASRNAMLLEDLAKSMAEIDKDMFPVNTQKLDAIIKENLEYFEGGDNLMLDSPE